MKLSWHIFNVTAVLLCATPSRAGADQETAEQTARTLHTGSMVEHDLCHHPDLDHILHTNDYATVRNVPIFCQQTQNAQNRLHARLVAEQMFTDKALQRVQSIYQQDKAALEQAYDCSPMELSNLVTFFSSRDAAVVKTDLSNAEIKQFSEDTRDALQANYEINLERRFNYLFPNQLTIAFEPVP